MNKRFKKKIMILLAGLTLVVSIFSRSDLSVYAHSVMLDVVYDNCIGMENNDGLNEAWYALEHKSGNVAFNIHLSHDIQTIKYYFEPSTIDGTYTWTTDISEAVANEIKTAYANSMKKWNNVYFYSYNSSGNVIKNKVINVIEGTEDDHNLSIRPRKKNYSIAATTTDYNYSFIDSSNDNHRHYNSGSMSICLDYFYLNSTNTLEEVNILRENTGAHELGHILGLYDIENYCGSNLGYYHHGEVLMGYDTAIENQSTDITYKDIAGVAIIRGFHTDADHMWLNCGRQTNGQYKLICSICNGVKYTSSLSGYTYDTYNACNGSHSLSSGNMMAVASYGNKDYYKCKYCRYVAPFSSNVTQNYSGPTYHSAQYHKYTNSVSGLAYTVMATHDFANGICTDCNFVHTHSNNYVYTNSSTHTRFCTCGDVSIQAHYVDGNTIVSGRYATCLGCGASLDLQSDFADIIMSPDNVLVSVNGSYILPSGVVVLVEEDIAAYENGTLQFYNRNDLPVTE